MAMERRKVNERLLSGVFMHNLHYKKSYCVNIKQYKSSLTMVSKTNNYCGTQLMLLLLHAGLEDKFLCWQGVGVGTY